MKLAYSVVALVGVSGCVLFAFYQRWELVDPPIAAILLCMLPVQLGAIVVVRRVFAIKEGALVFAAIFAGVYVLFAHTAALNAWLDGGPRSRHRVKVIERDHHRGGHRGRVVAHARRDRDAVGSAACRRLAGGRRGDRRGNVRTRVDRRRRAAGSQSGVVSVSVLTSRLNRSFATWRIAVAKFGLSRRIRLKSALSSR